MYLRPVFDCFRVKSGQELKPNHSSMEMPMLTTSKGNFREQWYVAFSPNSWALIFNYELALIAPGLEIISRP